MKRKDGGPAFPRAGYYPPTSGVEDYEHIREMLPTATEPQEGISLRDYFAGLALGGILANVEALRAVPPLTHEERAEAAYRAADAMLAARGE